MTEKEKKKEISRREFLRDAGLLVGGTAIGSTILLAACGGGETTETITKTQTQTATVTSIAPGETVTSTVTSTLPGTTVTSTTATTATQEVSRFICPTCGGEFETLSLLKEHIETVHPVELKSLPKSVGHIVQVPWEESVCISCGICEMVCGEVHEGDAGPSLRRIFLDRDQIKQDTKVLTCLQCDYPACYYACPYKDEALCIDKETGIRYINSDKCPSGCKICVEACAATFGSSRINFDPDRNNAIMCDLCKDREGGPACIEFCPTMCLVLQEGGV